MAEPLGDGIVLDYAVECGAVPDGPQLVPAIKRVARRIPDTGCMGVCSIVVPLAVP